MTDSSSISRFLVVAGLLIAGIIMAISVVTNPAGGLAALVPLIAGLLTILAIVKPKAGLYGLAGLVIWVDEFKRLAVYFGGANSMTVIQTLAMPFIVLAGLNAGFFLNLLFGRIKIDKLGIILFVLGGLVGVAIIATMEGSLSEKGQRAANVAGYMSLVPIAYTYLKSFEDWRKFFGFQALLAFPAAAWAIKQYYFGFDQIEWEYARSGLSLVHYLQMMNFSEPRVFGFFGSASSLGCVAIYCVFSWWHGIKMKKQRFLWLAIASVYFLVLIISTQRTALLYPFLVIPFVFAFRRPLTTAAAYATGAIVFVTAVIASDWLLKEGLDDINRAIAVEGGWGENVLNVSTFSDRLRGWQRLKRADSYSILGTGKQNYSSVTVGYEVGGADYNHDIINKILLNYGVLGILVIAIPGAFALFVLHRTIFHQQTTELRDSAAFVLALILPMIALSFVGGDNFNANPINIQLWTGLAGVFVCRSQSIAARRRIKRETWEEEMEREKQRLLGLDETGEFSPDSRALTPRRR